MSYFRLYNQYFGHDDLGYVELSYNLFQETSVSYFTSTNFGHRIVFYGLMSPFLYLFNFNPISWGVVPLLATIGTMYFVYVLTKPFGKQAQIVAVTLFCLNYYVFFFSNKIYPDSLLSFFFISAVYFLLNRNSSRSIVGFAICFILGLGTKMVMVFILPAVVVLFLKDFKNKKHCSFWFKTSVLTSLLGGVYLLLYWCFTGSPFTRFETFEATKYITNCSFETLPIQALINRLTIGMPLLFLASGMVTPLLIGLMAINKHYLKEEVLIALVVLCTFWFGTISLSFYVPLCTTEIRHFLPLAPLLSVVAAISISSINLSASHPQWAVVFIVVGLVGCYASDPIISLQLIGIGILLNIPMRDTLKVIFLIVLLSVKPLGVLMKKSELGKNVDEKAKRLEQEMKVGKVF